MAYFLSSIKSVFSRHCGILHLRERVVYYNDMKGDKIFEAIKNSGNDFHLEVAESLAKNGWDVEISPYYNDFITNKPREIDIIASRTHTVSGFGGSGSSMLEIHLFIDCKFLKNPNVLWFQKKDIKEANKLAMESPILRDVSTFDNGAHHYTHGGEVCKLTTKLGKDDVIYQGMDQCLKALIFFSENIAVANLAINYPIIVVNSLKNLYKRDKALSKGYGPISNNFQLEVNYSYINKERANKTKYFLLDVVAIDKLDEFLKILNDKDVEILKKELSWKLMELEKKRANIRRDKDYI